MISLCRHVKTSLLKILLKFLVVVFIIIVNIIISFFCVCIAGNKGVYYFCRKIVLVLFALWRSWYIFLGAIFSFLFVLSFWRKNETCYS